MSRQRRANSDLYGLKSLKDNKNYSFKDDNSTLNHHNLQAYQPKSSLSRKTACTETPSKKLDSQQLIFDTYKLIKHYYHNDDTKFYSRVKKYINGQWQSHKKNFNQHLNKLIYIEQEMQKKNFKEIQLEIVSQWRKNPVLYCIRAFWYEFVGGIKYNTILQFKIKYNIFKELVGQLAYLYFRRFFLSLGSPQQIQKVLDKLTERTSHLIITYTSTWSKLCDKIVIPLLKAKLISTTIQNFDVTKFSLQTLKIKQIAVDYKAQKIQMPKTVDSIQKFVLEHKILEKIKILIDIRNNMQTQITKRQQYLIKIGQLKSLNVLDKDDFVDCLIYCMVKSDISLQKLGLSIKYFHTLLGADLNEVLSKFRCDSYLADLEAVFDFLCQQAEKENKIVLQNTKDTMQSNDFNSPRKDKQNLIANKSIKFQF